MIPSMSSSNTAASRSGDATQTGSTLGGGFNVVFGSGSSIAASPGAAGVPSWFWMVAAGAVVLVAMRWKKRT